jgi:hypothetical protein
MKQNKNLSTPLVSHSLFLQTLPRKDDHKSHVYFRESLQDALALANGELSGLGTLALVFVIRNVSGNLSLSSRWELSCLLSLIFVECS